MAFLQLLICLSALSLSLCSAASVSKREIAEKIPFVPLTDIVAEIEGNSTRLTRRQADASELFPEEPTLAFQTYRTCNYIILLIVDFSAGGGGSPVFDGGNFLYKSYLKGNPAAASDYMEGEQAIPGLGADYPTFITPWLGPYPQCSEVVLNVTLTDADSTVTRYGSFHRGLSCGCDEGEVYGDPHTKTFDDRKSDVNRPCSYILAEDCEHTPPLWRITATNGRAVGRSHVRRIVSGEVDIHKHVLVLYENGTVISDGHELWNQNGDLALTTDLKVAILRPPNTVAIILPIEDDVYVEFDINHRMKVGLKEKHWKGKVCGLFGNDNDNPDDDFMIDGKEDVFKFKENWIIPGSCRDE